jgi:hypothetical protein
MAPLVLLLSIVVALATSCGSGEGAGNDRGHFVQTGSEVTVDLEVDPFPPQPMRKASFAITIADREGVPVGGAAVLCDMTMPSMMMPVNRPQVSEQGSGIYVAEVLFTMAGDWQAALEITLPDGRADTVKFAMSTR